MKVLIVEDEKLAFERLSRLLNNQSTLSIEHVTHASSIKEVVSIINNQTFDLAFFDIELSDGLSFEILEKTTIEFPIIFTTAYNQYAIQAFKHNSIDYLLKPIEKEELSTAILKFDKHWNNNKQQIDEKQLLTDFRNLLRDTYKKRFTIKVGEHIRMVETKDIALIYSRNKGTYLRTKKDSLVDYSLDKMMDVISPKQFFRISRKHIIALDKIKDIISYSNSRLKIILEIEFDEDLIVSREKVQEFKNWLEGEKG